MISNEHEEITVKNLSILNILRNELSLSIQSGFLMSRDRLGIPLRNYIVKQLELLKVEDTIVLDFQGIVEITTSVADEIGPILFDKYLDIFDAKSHQGAEKFLVYCNLSRDVLNGLGSAMQSWANRTGSSKKIVALGFEKLIEDKFSGFELLGESLPESQLEVLKEIYKSNEISSSELEKMDIKAASKKLNALAENYPWLFRRQKIRLLGTTKGWNYIYRPVVTATSGE